ncbi:hypothetical protein H2O64_02640 [Kordia sp. YSTF-M3]|uniref:Uncharacterized protein n=1 Tax=Kordia aestuariivivens TaxID=2759037 RepID=A0ABR7Q4S7_9FLAO|nr:hypothetical protein [Kordia aestuariivivens]MBC8753552.1 hypothetical protein [Kordia aestuariivivens]
MKKYSLLLIIVFIGCTTTKQTTKLSEKELFEKLSNGFIIQKLPNWTFHGFHGVLNYTPTDLMNVGYERIYNGITAYKRQLKNETLQSIVDEFISERKSYYEISKLKKVKEQTKYGESIVVIYTSVINNIEYKAIRQFYIYNNTLYGVSFSAKSKFFDFFVNDAIHMMETFTITK